MWSVLERIAAAVLPEVCVLCAAPAAGGFCRSCAERIARVPQPCRRCALPLRTGASHGCEPITGVDCVIAPFAFEPPLSDAIHDLKYGRRRPVGRALALLLARATQARYPASDALIPVPLHRSRLRERTFNQADEIARVLSRQTGVPLLATAAQRIAATPAQTLLAPDQRAANLRDAFAVRRRLTGLDVTIVDDVVTTGATAGALARVLLAAGATRISVWAIARTLHRDRSQSLPTGR